jgi:DNA polymerase-1
MYETECKKVTIVSTDRDFYQLVDERIQVWSPIKKKMYDIETVQEEFGVHPNNMVLYRSFTGDSSDNIPGVKGIGPKTLLKALPQLNDANTIGLNELFEECQAQPKSKSHQKILEHAKTIEQNYQLMNLKSLDFPAQTASKIRGIMEQPISDLNRAEFQRLFYEDKMWAIMKNLPDWLSNTWLSLSAFAKQTHK